jgi:hypothetical protein
LKEERNVPVRFSVGKLFLCNTYRFQNTHWYESNEAPLKKISVPNPIYGKCGFESESDKTESEKH